MFSLLIKGCPKGCPFLGAYNNLEKNDDEGIIEVIKENFFLGFRVIRCTWC